MIWDAIAGRDGPGVTEEWGGIGYSLAALAAALPADWQVRPLVKVGRDRAASAQAFLGDLPGVAPGGRFVEVPATNPCVTLRYQDLERRCEGLSGGVPPWTWEELGPMVLGLDALFVNFITGFEMDLATMRALRRGFTGPIYGDIHSLALGITAEGTRYLRPIDEALPWLVCFDAVQFNEDEMRQMGPEPLALAARALEQGVGAVCVTLGARGTVYVASAAFEGFGWAGGPRPSRRAGGGLVHTALLPPEGEAVTGDPTGCGDVFGGTMVARLLAGDPVEAAVRAANRMARRNVTFRGAVGLQRHLRGELLGATA
jgi:hypothetical protein